MVKKMRELTVVELQSIAGAGFIQTGLASIGGTIGALGYSAINSYLNITIPSVGTVNVADLFPGLGQQVGSGIGSAIGGTIESALTSIPLVGGLIGKLLG